MNRRSFLKTGAGIAAIAGTQSLHARGVGDAAMESHADIGGLVSARQRALDADKLETQSGLEEYAGPWSQSQAAHLLRRAGFQFSRADLEQALSDGRAATVEKLLTINQYPEAPGAWAQEAIPAQVSNQLQSTYYGYFVEMQRWWLHQMASSPHPLLEKMTFFWHNLFTSELIVVRYPQYMYMQNDMYRRHAYPHLAWQERDPNEYRFTFGNFKELAKYSVYDPAMLVYLNGNLNNAINPNENYAREIMELFTMGEGNYTEFDIVEAARSFTGWYNVRSMPYFSFEEKVHDFGTKNLLFDEMTGNPGMYGPGQVKPSNNGLPGGREEAQLMIDLIFRQSFNSGMEPGESDPRHVAEESEYAGLNIPAVYLAKKLYSFFVYETPTPHVVAQLAQEIVEHNFDLTPVLRTLFNSNHFYDPLVEGAMIKSPIEMSAGLVRQLELNAPANFNNNGFMAYIGNITGGARFAQTGGMELELLSPPNVAGWPGHRAWISTTTYPYRNSVTDKFIEGKIFSIGAQSDLPEVDVDVVNWVRAFDGSDDIYTLVDGLLALMIPTQLDEAQRQDIIDSFLLGSPDYEWAEIIAVDTTARVRVERGLQAIMRLPEYQLN